MPSDTHDAVIAPDDSSNDLNREANEVIGAIRELGKLMGQLTQSPLAKPAQFDVTAARQSTHVVLRTSALVVVPSAAGAHIVTIGTRTWTFTFSAGQLTPVVLPFVQLVDRGVDVFITYAAGTGSAYLIYTPE